MKLSVLMSAYRERQDHLRRAIESILSQTFSDFEFVILLDDPENAPLAALISDYAARDRRIRFLINPQNLGLPASLNRGLSLCTGDYVARMDADDVSLPSRFERELAYLAEHPDCRVVSVNIVSIDEENRVLSHGAPLPDRPETVARALRYYNSYSHPGAMFDRRTVLSLGGYRPIRYAEDYDLWLRFVSAGYGIGCLNEHLLLYRLSSGGVSRRYALTQWYASRYCLRLFRERRRGEDSYSPEHHDAYLAARHVTDASAERFGIGMARLNRANDLISDKRFFRGGACLVRAFFTHREIFSVFWHVLRYKLTVRRG